MTIDMSKLKNYRRVSMPNGSRGFSLVELMMVIVIIAILASVAVPGYRDYVQRAQRVDATAALLRIAAAQEKALEG